MSLGTFVRVVVSMVNKLRAILRGIFRGTFGGTLGATFGEAFRIYKLFLRVLSA